MARKKFSILRSVEGNRRVTRTEDKEFYQKLEIGLLMALRELEKLTEEQYGTAVEKL